MGLREAQRNKLTGDRRAGDRPPAGVRLSDGLGCNTMRSLCDYIELDTKTL